MTTIEAVALMTALLPMLLAPVSAHPLEEPGTQLAATGKSFQPVDMPAPDFTLQHEEANPIWSWLASVFAPPQRKGKLQ